MPVYHGKICEKHPDAEGRRYTGSGKCTKCQSARVAARIKQRREIIAHSRSRPEEWEVLRFYEGEVCQFHRELNGKRFYVTRRCVGCERERQRIKNFNRYHAGL